MGAVIGPWGVDKQARHCPWSFEKGCNLGWTHDNDAPRPYRNISRLHYFHSPVWALKSLGSVVYTPIIANPLNTNHPTVISYVPASPRFQINAGDTPTTSVLQPWPSLPPQHLLDLELWDVHRWGCAAGYGRVMARAPKLYRGQPTEARPKLDDGDSLYSRLQERYTLKGARLEMSFHHFHIFHSFSYLI